MRRYYRQRVRVNSEEAQEAPREIKRLDEQIARLKKRQVSGDKDLTHDKLETIINGKLAHRAELLRCASRWPISMRTA
jgi:hypothetical protein